MNAVSGRPDGLGVDHRRVAADHAALLEPADPLVHRRGGQPGGLAQVGVAHPAVAARAGRRSGGRVLHARTPYGVRARSAADAAGSRAGTCAGEGAGATAACSSASADLADRAVRQADVLHGRPRTASPPGVARRRGGRRWWWRHAGRATAAEAAICSEAGRARARPTVPATRASRRAPRPAVVLHRTVRIGALPSEVPSRPGRPRGADVPARLDVRAGLATHSPRCLGDRFSPCPCSPEGAWVGEGSRDHRVPNTPPGWRAGGTSTAAGQVLRASPSRLGRRRCPTVGPVGGCRHRPRGPRVRV